MGATLTLGDRLYVRRLLARNGWGQETCKLTRFAFYVSSHWLRMPPAMLARHLWAKWRKDRASRSKGALSVDPAPTEGWNAGRGKRLPNEPASYPVRGVVGPKDGSTNTQ